MEKTKKYNGLDLFLMEYENLDTDGIFAMSLVDIPAVEKNFVKLSKQCEGICHTLTKANLSDDSKRIITGVALIPDKPILRVFDDRKFYIQFSKDTVKRIAEEYITKRNVTVAHAVNVNNIALLESWIVEDEYHDKSNMYNMKAPLGSWIISMRIDNDLVWDEVKQMNLRGFSIEGLFTQKVALKSDDMYDELWGDIRNFASNL